MKKTGENSLTSRHGSLIIIHALAKCAIFEYMETVKFGEILKRPKRRPC